ncbi:MAG: hypothetical protein PHS71_03290 [Proteiniphilum sp.]|nr:hypothetical protein [Proteiniphilum sp.]
MAQQADLILFVGDIFDSQIETVLRQGMDQELRRLSAPLGVYTCTGNHEYRYDSEQKIKLLNDAGIDIALYGHTHHGQVFPGNLITDCMFEVAHGYRRKGNTHVYVTSGLGLVGPQYRIGTVSEMVLLTVHFGKGSTDIRSLSPDAPREIPSAGCNDRSPDAPEAP